MATITLKTPEDVNNFPEADGTYDLSIFDGRNTKKTQIKIAGQVITFVATSTGDDVGKSVSRIDFLTTLREGLTSGKVTIDVTQVGRPADPQTKQAQSHSWWWIAALVGAAVLYHSRKKSA